MNGLLERIETGLSGEVLPLVRALGQQASSVGTPLYLVGGSVRDLLLGQPVKDVDLVVEGEAAMLALEAARALGGQAVSYRQFGTATLKVDGQRLDLATARSERYARPGALPTVAPATIAEDLGRRDFSINAMAIGLSEPHPGRLLDPHQGRHDLEAGLIRVLHSRSFVDDATRILRAVRYEQRLGFHLEEQTEGLLRNALRQGMLDTISSDRVRRELGLLLEEPHPGPALRRAVELGLFQAIYPPLKGAPALTAALGNLRRGDPLLALALLAYPLTPPEAEGLVQRLKMPKRWALTVRQAAELRGVLPSLSGPALSPLALCQALDGYQPAVLRAGLLAAPWPEVRERLQQYLRELRYVNPLLRGDDLLALGVPQGPQVGRLLQELWAARLEGRVKTRKDEEALVRQHLAHNPAGG